MKKSIITTTLLTMLAIAAISVYYVYATCNNWQAIIYPRVYIEDIDVSGKQPEEVEELIEKEYGMLLLSKKIEIEVASKLYSLDYGNLDARYNIEEVVTQAFSYGKQGNIIEKYKLIKGKEKKAFKLAFTYNSKPVDELLDTIEQESNINPVNAKITIVNGNISITPEISEVKVQRNPLKEMIIVQINGKLSDEIIRIKAPLHITKPETTAEKLSNNYTLISSFSTSFPTSTVNRINNINLATIAINGTLLMPGETFSFNKIVGERTRERGYKEAGVIIGDRIESGLGGGICQVSSTLYNTMLTANIKAYERRNHTLPLSYIPKGLDATVDWGNIDLKFKNTLNTPMYIEGYTKNKNVYFNIYSSLELTKISYKTMTNVFDTLQPTIKYIDDPNRLESETVVVKKASLGYKVKAYRKTYENGKLIYTELISNDYYRAINGEVLRGTKKLADEIQKPISDPSESITPKVGESSIVTP